MSTILYITCEPPKSVSIPLEQNQNLSNILQNKDLTWQSAWSGEGGIVFVLVRDDQAGSKNTLLLKTRLQLEGAGTASCLQWKDICHLGKWARQRCHTTVAPFAISPGNSLTGAWFTQSLIKRNRLNGSAIMPHEINITLFKALSVIAPTYPSSFGSSFWCPLCSLCKVPAKGVWHLHY